MEPDKEILDHEVPYLNTIGALMYLAQCIRQISLLWLIYLYDLVLSQPGDIGTELNTFFIIF